MSWWAQPKVRIPKEAFRRQSNSEAFRDGYHISHASELAIGECGCMGITIHYRGTMHNLASIEEMEDRVVDLVFSLGGQATIWRSFADHDPSRVVRGLLLEMAPGQDTLSLLVSPEGHLINLFEIEEAEKQPMKEPPFCFVKTQFGSLCGHVAVVYLLDTLKTNYFPQLEVNDEGGFYEHRDPNRLATELARLGAAIRSMADGLQEYGLTDEALEDPNILVARIERIASLVSTKLDCRAADGSQKITSTDSDADSDADVDDSLDNHVAREMKDYRRRLMRSERMLRRLRELEASGEEIGEALRKALREEGLDIEANAQEPESTDWIPNEASEPSEPWLASIDPMSFQEHESELDDEAVQHPAVIQVQSCLVEVFELGERLQNQSPFARIAANGLMDTMGGLVQATSIPGNDLAMRAYGIAQLRRALKGLAYFRGAVFGLSSAKFIERELLESWLDSHDQLIGVVQELLAKAWDE